MDAQLGISVTGDFHAQKGPSDLQEILFFLLLPLVNLTFPHLPRPSLRCEGEHEFSLLVGLEHRQHAGAAFTSYRKTQ